MFHLSSSSAVAAAGALLLLAANQAFAGAADDAKAHFQAIADADVPAVMRGYADDARFQWVGGPLDGTYTSAPAIRGVWEKFAKAQGPSKHLVSNLEESTNPKGSTVSANVQFAGQAPVKVRYVLTFRDGKIVGETWQIDPQLAVSPAY